MNNTKELIERALRTLPQDFALRDVRYHLARAIAEYNHVEERRAKKQTVTSPRQKWEMNLKTGQLVNTGLHPVVQQNALAQIEALIQAEEEKLKNIGQPGKKDELLTD